MGVCMQVPARVLVSRGDVGGPEQVRPPRIPKEPEFEFSQQRQVSPRGGRAGGSPRGARAAAPAPPAGQQLKKDSSSSTGGSGGEVSTSYDLDTDATSDLRHTFRTSEKLPNPPLRDFL